MIAPLEGMPDGTIGFRATGRVTADEYRDVLLPAMRAAAQAGDVRMVFAIGPDFERFEAGALAQDTKAGITLGIGHPHAWTRTAVVTDVDWIAKAMHLFGWLTPGEVKLYGLDGLEHAKAWSPGSARLGAPSGLRAGSELSDQPELLQPDRLASQQTARAASRRRSGPGGGSLLYCG